MSTSNEYNWVDDPFNDRKDKQIQSKMSGKSKAAIGCGCLGVIIAFVILCMLFLVNLDDLVSSMSLM